MAYVRISPSPDGATIEIGMDGLDDAAHLHALVENAALLWRVAEELDAGDEDAGP